MLEKIGHYSLTHPASVYDEEALTALELCARTAGKVNEAVQAFNELETDTNAHLEAQDKRIPEVVGETVQNHIESGTFESQIDTFLGNLKERLETLLGSVKNGSSRKRATWNMCPCTIFSRNTAKQPEPALMNY